jgi:hypothetical protein
MPPNQHRVEVPVLMAVVVAEDLNLQAVDAVFAQNAVQVVLLAWTDPLAQVAHVKVLGGVLPRR